MKLKEGMYARTLDGIMKVVELRDDGVMTRFRNEDGNIYFANDMMCNPSFNIIDLIEVGDYVNGCYVDEIISDNDSWDDRKHFHLLKFISYFGEEDIKSIVTKEQFESMSYKVGE